MVVDSDKRFLLLFSFLKRMQKKKIIVFFSSCNCVKYHSELLNYIDLPVLDLHGRSFQKWAYIPTIHLVITWLSESGDADSKSTTGKQKQQV